MVQPESAIIAVTLNCNSRCIMCDIWKNHFTNELTPQEYLRLPASLKNINITGGEPFLRRDITDVYAAIQTACKKAKIIISTNGFLYKKIEQDMQRIYAIDPHVGIRISIDGLYKHHDRIRNIPKGFHLIQKTIACLRHMGIKDMGIGFTVMNQNQGQAIPVQKFAHRMHLDFSVTVATSSPIYFGEGKTTILPSKEKTIQTLERIALEHFKHGTWKDLQRMWFVRRLKEYQKSHIRPIPCDAGRGFFYLDSLGNIYTCHMKPWIMGNIRKNSFADIWKNRSFDARVEMCQDCWMVCTARTAAKKHFLKTGIQLLGDVVKTVV